MNLLNLNFPFDYIILCIIIIFTIFSTWKGFIQSVLGLLTWIGSIIITLYSYNSFAKLIIKNSKVQLINIENEVILRKFLKQTAYGQKIYIGMGAGSISNWMKNLKNNI